MLSHFIRTGKKEQWPHYQRDRGLSICFKPFKVRLTRLVEEDVKRTVLLLFESGQTTPNFAK